MSWTNKPRPKGALTPAATSILLATEGFASLSAEILALRWTAPWAGTSIVVTSILLAAYLAALAAGYETASRIAAAQRGPDPGRIGIRLAAAACWSAGTLSTLGTTLFYTVLPAPPLVQAAAYSLFGAAPIAFLLAQTLVFLHEDRRATQDAGDTSAGRSFGLSTAGNVCGALGTSLIILTYAGTGTATAIVCAILAAGAAACLRAENLPKSRARERAAVLLTGCAILSSLALLIDHGRYLERNAYGNYQLVEPNGERWLVMNNMLASRDTPDGEGWPYIERIERELCTAGAQRVLVLGAAGRTLGRGTRQDCKLDPTFVDIDPAQARISAEEFLYGDPPGPLHAADARAYMRQTDAGTWDAVVSDVYSHSASVPEHLMTVEFLRETRRALAPAGIFVLNVITNLDDRNARFESRLDRTVRSIYARCRTVIGSDDASTNGETRNQNTLYFCPRHKLDGDRSIYTDRRTTAALDERRLPGRSMSNRPREETPR